MHASSIVSLSLNMICMPSKRLFPKYLILWNPFHSKLGSHKKRKHVEKLLERTIYVSVESYLADIQVDYLFLNKKELSKKLSVFAIVKNFQFCVHRSNKKLYILICFDSAFLWKLKGYQTERFKYESTHTRQKNYEKTRSQISKELGQSRTTSVQIPRC